VPLKIQLPPNQSINEGKKHPGLIASENWQNWQQPLKALINQPVEAGQSLNDIEGALAVIGQLEALPVQHSATASEIAERLHGASYTLDHVIEIYHACEALRAAGILIGGHQGYGYQIAPSKGHTRTEANT
jgi:hypothetical protein